MDSSAREKLSELMSALESNNLNDISRATSPGGEIREMDGTINEDGKRVLRSRPRTYPYFRYLPYGVENNDERLRNFEEILKHLYVAVESGDFSPGAVYWTREIRSWLGLKFEVTTEQRVKLVKLYYELALAPGIDVSVADRFASMFMVLTKRKHYLRPVKDLILDWRPLFRELKVFVLPTESGMVSTMSSKRSIRTLTKMCTFAQLYFDPGQIPEMFKEILPFFSTSFAEGGFVVAGLLNLLLPTFPASKEQPDIQPQYYLPTFFHLWSLISRSKVFDATFLDLLSRMARDNLQAKHIPFSAYGIFTKEQSDLIFTAVLRLIEIPVGQATSPYSGNVDITAGLGTMLDRDPKKHPIAHHVARWIVMSLSPACLDEQNSVLGNLEGLIEAVETFFHPSNVGGWTKTLAQLVYYLADFFVMRWNREHSGEMEIPPERKLSDPLKRRFVLCLRDVIFMGIFAKSGTAMNFSLSTLQSLAYLEPDLILPGALQRIYPSMQGLVEVHRTTSSLRALQHLSRTLIRTKGYRCHVMSLLGLALPGIDANDLEKTLYTLSYIQSVCYNVPLHKLTKDKDGISDSMIAQQWIAGEVDRMEQEGTNVELDYQNQLSDEDEELVLRSSTASLDQFVSQFLGKVFVLLENLPEASRVRSGSPEENIVNTLPATFTPLLASLSPELFDLALNKIVDFITNHVIHQARDAMAFICNALCKVQPERALKRLVPTLIQSIRTEIDENLAASTRNTGSDVLPRDRGLVWSVSMLSMSVVHVGSAVLKHKQELFDIAVYMQQKCKGIPTVHVSNYIHHLLLNLTTTFTVDYSIYESDVLLRGPGPEDWGKNPKSEDLNIKWHVPQREELEFAVDLFKSQCENALRHLTSLTDGSSSIKRDGSGKEWSDEVSRNLVLLRLLLSGVSVLFDAKAASKAHDDSAPLPNGDAEMIEAIDLFLQDKNADDLNISLAETDDDEDRPTFQYPTGYLLKEDDAMYQDIHKLRERTGRVLHEVHQFLVEKQEDDVACFSPLYTAYRSWFIDVGIERSAHTLDRVTRLLAADIQPYKVSGLRKDYPRPILLRRANVYHLYRLRHNAYPRPKTELDKVLLLDLAQSSVSLYTEVRRNAQNAGDMAIKSAIGAKSLVIPPLIQALEEAVKKNDYPRIKGAMYSLLLGSLSKTIGRDWRYTPSVIKAYIAASTVDKPSVQKLCSGVTYQIMDYGRPLDRPVILDKTIVQTIAPSDDVQTKIASKREKIIKKRDKVEIRKTDLCNELVDMARQSHWKKASRTAAIVVTLALRFESIASEDTVDLIAKGAVDSHPGLRGLYSGAFVGLFAIIDVRAVCDHDYENYLLDKQSPPAKIKAVTRREESGWTEAFLKSFSRPEADYYVDHDHPGWLVWQETMPAYKSNPREEMNYDDREKKILYQIGRILDRKWFRQCFAYLKQEPRDSHADKFRVPSAMMLAYAFQLVYDGFSKTTFEDIKEEVKDVFGDGSDKHQHRATAEILGALLSSTVDKKLDIRAMIWDYAFGIVQKIFADGLTPENSGYWAMFLHLVLQGKDPRRAWPIVDWLASFRLDMSSNAAFKESSQIILLQQCIADIGWHFQLEKPILADFLAHLDHPYKGVREAMGSTLAVMYRTRYHESYKDIDTLIDSQRAASSIGTRPYQLTQELSENINTVFARLEQWRLERTPGDQSPTPYTTASKTVCLWLDSTLSSHECTQLIPFFPETFMPQLLHMMDIKEDQELQALAYVVFRHIANIPHLAGEDSALIKSLIHMGTTATSWHQRLRILINIQVLYFRRLFLLDQSSQQSLLDCVAAMLNDTQLEVRLGASTTLSGMIRCSRVAFRDTAVKSLNARFTKMLINNPLPKKPKASGALGSSNPGTGTSTPTPEHTKLVLTRHAAVLGLGALVQAFPYQSPPPAWIPGVLATLANKANGDPGMVGKSVKSVLSDFKKTRQDTWHVDLKAFSAEQAEDLDGVLWKSYFA